MEVTAASRRDDASSRAFARRTLELQADALRALVDVIDERFDLMLSLCHDCRGDVIVTGMGKAGLIGQKLSATFCSTGTRSIFLHPAEAIHGDLGRVTDHDLVLALSMSGETEEVVRLIPSLQQIGVTICAITASRHSRLGRASRVVLELGKLTEACDLGLAPSTSTTAMLAIGDALALTLSRLRGFRDVDFAKYHPGGSLGRKLTRVQDMMRPLEHCRIARPDDTVRKILVARQVLAAKSAGVPRQNRRSGAVLIVDEQGQLAGLFTDSDLARLLEHPDASLFDQPVAHVMTRDPITCSSTAMMPTAIERLARHRISELPIVDAECKLVGMIDITDVIAWIPDEEPATHPHPRADGHHAPAVVRFPHASSASPRTQP